MDARASSLLEHCRQLLSAPPTDDADQVLIMMIVVVAQQYYIDLSHNSMLLYCSHYGELKPTVGSCCLPGIPQRTMMMMTTGQSNVNNHDDDGLINPYSVAMQSFYNVMGVLSRRTHV